MADQRATFAVNFEVVNVDLFETVDVGIHRLGDDHHSHQRLDRVSGFGNEYDGYY